MEDEILNANLQIKKNTTKEITNLNEKWRTPNSLRDSNVNPKLKTTKEQGIGAVPWFAAL
jgi:hypothetical protein